MLCMISDKDFSWSDEFHASLRKFYSRFPCISIKKLSLCCLILS